MKNEIVILFITIFSYFSTEVSAQHQSTSSYDSNCNLWRIENNSSYNQNISSSSLFSWKFVVAPVSASMQDVFFIDSLFGWAGHTGNGGIRTTNSGFNWEIFSFNDTTFTTVYNGVYFIDRNIGWCVGGGVQIRKTTNGGVNWFKQYGPPVAGIARSVYFFDANTGIIVGSKNFPYQPFIAKTTNGGNNWAEITPATSGQELNDQFWLNSNTGWVCGYDVLLYTTNGGANFSNLYSNIPPTANGHSSLLGIYFTNQQTGWIGAANLERNNTYKTTNAGVNWIFQNNPVSQAGWNQINDIKFISKDSGWAAHGTPGTGAIMFTSNGGANWNMDNTQYSWYDCFATYRSSKVWCGGSDGTMWYTLITGLVGIDPEYTNDPKQFVLYQNYPNPFNPSTLINYELRITNYVLIRVYDILGSEVATLIKKKQAPGKYSIEFDAANYPSGIYYYKIVSGNFVAVRKMLLIK